MKQKDKKIDSVPAEKYSEEWIHDTWGWDTPEEFVRTQGRNLRPRVSKAIDLADLSEGMKILDIGCGRGEVVLHCARMGVNSVGVDYSKEIIEIANTAKATHAEQEQELMEFICDDVKNLNTQDKFDRIFMLDLVEHLHDWELLELFEHCHKVLAPNGCIIIHTLPNKWVYEITYRRLLRLFMPWLPRNPRSEFEKTIHVNEMSIVHLSNILSEGDFKSRVWLQDMIVEQSKWHKKQPFADNRGRLYRWLANPVIGLMYKLIAKTPLKLLIVNEMLAVGWKSESSLSIKMPFRLTESLVIWLHSRRK
jgi:2-polyprenyl-3-methyl-5-hydroxy-6-metoxy-1,4-benzoquinol methylase